MSETNTPWWSRMASSAIGSFTSSATPYIVLIVLAGLAVGVASAKLWHENKIKAVTEEAYNKGRAEVTESWKLANAAEALKQERLAATADETFQEKTSNREVRYVTKVEEITHYVPDPNAACPVDTDFVRRFNAYGGE